MNLQQLAAFREVMKTGSVSAAARNLNRTQPAVSAALKALEASLDMALFERQGRRLVPVPEAHYLQAEAGEILDRLSAAETTLAGMRNRSQGLLRLVAMPGPSSYLLPDFVSRFTAAAPDVRVTLATRSSPQILNLIAAQSFDIGFCDMGFCDTPEGDAGRDLYDAETIFSECLCALPADHPLAGRERLHAADLDGQPMGVLQPDHSTHRDTRRAFESCGAAFKIRVDAQYFLPLFHFVEAGQACAVVDVLSAESYRRSRGATGRIRFVPFAPVVPFGYGVVTPRQRPLSVLARDFVSAWTGRVTSIIDSAGARLEPGAENTLPQATQAAGG